MKKLLALLFLVGALTLSSPAHALTTEEDSISCHFSLSATVGWNQCSNNPFTTLTLNGSLYGQIKLNYSHVVYVNKGEPLTFGCGLKRQPRNVTIDGWLLNPVVGSPGKYNVLFHVTQTNTCLVVVGAQLEVLLFQP